MRFEVVGEMRAVAAIASGRAVRDRRRLNRDGTICEAELHWYEAHGIGRKEIKFKKPLG
jgi:hypothetical protein